MMGVEENLYIGLLNKEAAGALGDRVPYKEVFGNLILVPYLNVKQRLMFMEREWMKLLGLSDEEVLDRALANAQKLLPAQLLPIGEVLEGMAEPVCVCIRELFPEPVPECGNMYVLTNSCKVLGASVLCYEGIPEWVSREIGNRNYYVLPSSVHEGIILMDPHEGDEEAYKPEELLEIVAEINQKEVAPEERLADAVYYYDAGRQKLELVAEKRILNVESDIPVV